jgi:hypothetical protein
MSAQGAAPRPKLCDGTPPSARTRARKERATASNRPLPGGGCSDTSRCASDDHSGAVDVCPCTIPFTGYSPPTRGRSSSQGLRADDDLGTEPGQLGACRVQFFGPHRDDQPVDAELRHAELEIDRGDLAGRSRSGSDGAARIRRCRPSTVTNWNAGQRGSHGDIRRRPPVGPRGGIERVGGEGAASPRPGGRGRSGGAEERGVTSVMAISRDPSARSAGFTTAYSVRRRWSLSWGCARMTKAPPVTPVATPATIRPIATASTSLRASSP